SRSRSQSGSLQPRPTGLLLPSAQGLRALAAKYAAHSPQPERMAEGQQRVEAVQTALAETVQDAFALAILNTVAANAPLVELVNGRRPIDRSALRQAVKDY